MSLRIGFSASAGLLLFVACAPSNKPAPPTDAAVVAVVPVEAGPVDPMQCAGCQLAPSASWTFEGIYRDAACTEPLAQIDVPSCAVVPALGSTNLTYVDEAGLRKAGESVNVTIAEQIGADAARFRKAGTKCVKANETATAITPANCASQRACRDGTGALACTGCRTLATGCADYEETRLYGSISDPGLKAGAATGGGGNLSQLQQCCAALGAQAASLGASPEAGVLRSVAAQCMALVAQAGPSGTAPELGVVRTALAGRKVPAVCAKF